MKRNEKRFHIEVEGQVVSIYFHEKWNQCHCAYTYEVGVRISNSKRSNNDWYAGGKGYSTGQVTGRCGIKGLLVAKQVILDFAQSLPRDGYDKCIVITGDDKRRYDAYRIMCKHGFVKGTYGDEDCYFMMIV